MFNCPCLDTSTLSQVAKFDGAVLEIYGVSQIDYYYYFFFEGGGQAEAAIRICSS